MNSKHKKILSAILPGLVVAGLIFSANLYYDLDLGKVIVEQITRIVGMFETTATTTLATLSGYVGIKTATPTEALTVAGNILATGNLTISAGKIFGANQEELWLGVTNDIVNVVRGGSTYIVCDSSGNCVGGLSYIGGSGTAGYIPKFTATSTLGNSIITDNGTLVTVSGQFRATGTTTLATSAGNVGIGTTAPSTKLHIQGGTLRVENAANQDAIILSGRAGGTGGYAVTIVPATLTANRTLTLADGNTTLVAGTMVPTSRTISTTAPLSGGGDLSANRTLSLAGLTSLGTGNYVVGVKSDASGWEYKNIVGVSSEIDITHSAGQIQIGIVDPLAVSKGGTGRSSLTTGYVLFGAGTSAVGLDSNLFWDNTNKRLGIGTTAPATRLDVLSTATQARLSYSGSVYANLTVDSAGNLKISTYPTGKDIQIDDNNLRVCAGGSCPTPSYSGTGNLQVEGRIQIDAPAGTAPMIITSTTMVPNLNADMLDGYHASAFRRAREVGTVTLDATSCDNYYCCLGKYTSGYRLINTATKVCEDNGYEGFRFVQCTSSASDNCKFWSGSSWETYSGTDLRCVSGSVYCWK